MSELSSFLKELHKNETLEDQREKGKKRQQKWYNNMMEDDDKYKRFLRDKQIKNWKKKYETIPPDEFWKKLARLYMRDPELAKEIKNSLN